MLAWSFGEAATRAVFGGLLPEGTPREAIARRLGLSADNDFALLEERGRALLEQIVAVLDLRTEWLLGVTADSRTR